MAKFGQAGKTGGQLNALQRLAAAELPTGTPIQEEQVAQQAPAPTPQVQPQVQPQAQPTPVPEGPELEPIQEGIQSGIGQILEEHRQSIPDLRARSRGLTKLNDVNKSAESSTTDGGIINRAKNMATAVQDGTLIPAVSLSNTPGFIPAREGATSQEVADAIAQEKEGSLIAAVNRAGAITNINEDPRNPRFDPDYLLAASMTTENMIMNLAQGDRDAVDAEPDPIADALEEEQVQPAFRPGQKPKQIAKAQSNGKLGQQIHQEYQRMKGVTVPEKLPQKEAETVGDAFKEMWALQNPKLVRRTRDNATQQVYLELTPLGEDVLNKGGPTRKTLFPNKHVKPSKEPLITGRLLGDVGQNVVRDRQGSVGKQDFSKAIDDAMVNLCLLYTSPSPRDRTRSRMPSSA